MNNQSAARLDRLQAILREGSPLQLSDAAQLCGVSEMTIRRDVTHSNGLLEILGDACCWRNLPPAASIVSTARSMPALLSSKRCASDWPVTSRTAIPCTWIAGRPWSTWPRHWIVR
ncbi:DeoR family transcriptional regulator [Cobetia marina]